MRKAGFSNRSAVFMRPLPGARDHARTFVTWHALTRAANHAVTGDAGTAGDAMRSTMAKIDQRHCQRRSRRFCTATQPFMPRLDDPAQVALKAKSRLGNSTMRCPRNGLILPGHAEAAFGARCDGLERSSSEWRRHDRLSLIGGSWLARLAAAGTQRLQSAGRTTSMT